MFCNLIFLLKLSCHYSKSVYSYIYHILLNPWIVVQSVDTKKTVFNVLNNNNEANNLNIFPCPYVQYFYISIFLSSHKLSMKYILCIIYLPNPSSHNWLGKYYINTSYYLLYKINSWERLVSTDSKCSTFLTFPKSFNPFDSELGKFLRGFIFH